MSSPVVMRMDDVITCGCEGVGGCHHLWLWGCGRVSSPVVVSVWEGVITCGCEGVGGCHHL